MSTDWFPGRRDDILAMAKMWPPVFIKHFTTWTVTSEMVTEMDGLITAAETAHKANRAATRNAVTRAQADEAFRALSAFMRDLRRRHFFSPPLVESDWVSLGLRPPDTIRTPQPVPAEWVEFVIDIRGTRQVHISFRVAGATHRAKPVGYDGAVVIWDVLDTPPVRPDDLNRHTMASRTPHTIEFDETERGRTVYVSAAWQNEKGQLGPWAEIQSAVIP